MIGISNYSKRNRASQNQFKLQCIADRFGKTVLRSLKSVNNVACFHTIDL